MKQIIDSLPEVQSVRPLASHAAAALLRISGRTINNILQRVQDNGWVPRDVQPPAAQNEAVDFSRDGQ